MNETYELLKQMRGETSQPLLDELMRIIKIFKDEHMTLMVVQVESQLVTKGLTLFLSSGPKPTAFIFLARREVPGFIPYPALGRLASANWVVVDDSYGKEFSVVSKELAEGEISDIALQLVHGLEALGAPQRHIWKLYPEFRPKFDVNEKDGLDLASQVP